MPFFVRTETHSWTDQSASTSPPTTKVGLKLSVKIILVTRLYYCTAHLARVLSVCFAFPSRLTQARAVIVHKFSKLLSKKTVVREHCFHIFCLHRAYYDDLRVVCYGTDNFFVTDSEAATSTSSL